MSCGLSIERVYWIRVVFAPLGGILVVFGAALANLGAVFQYFWLTFDFANMRGFILLHYFLPHLGEFLVHLGAFF